ncbi:MAG TPA: hypothetical protein PLU58_14365 [Saprospiraceae bacterium]|nr:hypothetical protein [Saprospiraceae bacterium]
MAVAIYIYIDEVIDSVLTPVAHRIELFKDEEISITSSIQNFRDLGKIFTDYSQTFTVPASAHNNKIFKYWFDSEVGATSLDVPTNVDGAFDHRISYYSFIEIDTIPFRFGKLLLKGTKKVNNKIESYSIQFTGNLVQLKERFKEDKLNSLFYLDEDGIRISLYDELNHEWNLTEVENRVTDASSVVCYPLIGTKRKLWLDSGVPSKDISNPAGKLMFDEIFPALQVTRILQYIQTCYGITFSGAFIQSLTFSKLYLYLKNQNELDIKLQQTMIDFDSKQDYTEVFGSPIGGSSDRSDYKFDDLDLDSNVLTFDTDYAPFFSPFTSLPLTWTYRQLILSIATASSNTYNLHVYNNGVLYNTFEGLVGNTNNTVFANSGFGWNSSSNDFTVYNFSFFVSSESGITFTSTLIQSIRVISSQAYTGVGGPISFPTQTQVLRGYSSSQTTSSYIDIKSFIPDITVEAFMTGLIKMFNLMVIPVNETSFYLQPLTNYYDDGKTWDLTQYVITDSIDIDPPKLYRKIDFKFENSENILNNAFRGLFNREYGDLGFENKNSAFAETYEIKVPFEDFMFERETGTDFITATIFDKDLQSYIPKTSLIYNNGLQSVSPSIKIADNSTTDTITSYVRFTNELMLAATDLSYTQTLNWSAEISSWSLVTAFIGLYQKFYSNYIENLYNQRTRVLKIKTILPNSVLCFFKLRDKVIISNKRYIVNTMTPKLSTKETEFELVLDNSPNIPPNSNDVLRMSNITTLNLDNTAQEIEAQIFLKDNDLWRGKIATGFLSTAYAYGTNFYEDGLLTVSVPANATGLERQDGILIEFYKGGISFTFTIPVTQNA